jgi:hypothetical protein
MPGMRIHPPQTGKVGHGSKKIVMPSRVQLTPLTSGKWGATCGGCVTYSHAIVAETSEAWAQLEALGWTVYQYGPNMRAYPKCPKCSRKPTVATPPRPRRYR